MNEPASWTPDELDAIGRADEAEITTSTSTGRSTATPIWIVRVADGVYVRSYRGPDGGWYRRALRSGTARVAVGGIELDVTVSPASDVPAADVDAAYRAKYGRSPYTTTMVEPLVATTTLRLTPRHEEDR